MKNKIPDRNAAPQYQPSKHTRPDPGTLASLAKPHVSVLYLAHNGHYADISWEVII